MYVASIGLRPCVMPQLLQIIEMCSVFVLRTIRHMYAGEDRMCDDAARIRHGVARIYVVRCLDCFGFIRPVRLLLDCTSGSSFTPVILNCASSLCECTPVTVEYV